jgi:hypothetical protein
MVELYKKMYFKASPEIMNNVRMLRETMTTFENYFGRNLKENKYAGSDFAGNILFLYLLLIFIAMKSD